MASTKKIRQRQYNGTDWDTLHPETEWAQITDHPTASTSTPSAVSSSAGSAGSATTYSKSDHTHKLTVTNKNAYLAWGATTTIATIGTTNITIRMPNNPVCLLEGTKITLSNYQEKLIQDVVAGDEILSYNPQSNELCTGVVMANIFTGEDKNELKEAIFEDGSSILVYKDHGVFKAQSDADALSEYRSTGICSWRRSNNDKDYALNINREKVALLGIEDFDSTTPLRHYNILTSCIYYFADGILCSGSQWQQVQDIISEYEGKLNSVGRADLITKLQILDGSVKALIPTFKDKKIQFSERDENHRLKKKCFAGYKRRVELLRLRQSLQEEIESFRVKHEKEQEGLLAQEKWEEAKRKKAEIRLKINAIDDEIIEGDINKHGTPEHEQQINAVKQEIAMLIANRTLFDEVISVVTNSQ